MKRFLVLLVFTVQWSFAQDVLENNPTTLKWMQVNSPNFRVIFPQGFDFQAQRVAATLERIRSAEAKTMGVEPRKISIILQNQSSISNGFVSMFPRRSEFYTMPAQNYNFAGSNDWLDLLATHEYRHIVQYQHASRGFNKFLLYLFGSPTMAAMAQAAAPDWFWEGDAVATETAFTPSGRGKIPNFNLVFRTNIVEGRTFNYHKQYLRSYKHEIPNHYVLGYNMVSWLRRKTGDPEIWERISARAWSVPFLPFTFSTAIKRETGSTVTQLYREMASDLKQKWQQQIDTLQLTPFESLVQRESKAYTNYLYPQPQPDGSVVVLREGIGHIAQLVRVNGAGEKVLFTPGFINDAGMLSSANGIIVWNEFGFDPRWLVRNYSLVKSYDVNNKHKELVSDRESRFGAAAISPDAKSIVTVQTDENYNHRLVMLSYPEGAVEKMVPNPDNHFYAMPRWSVDGNSIVAIKISKEGKTISRINAKDGSEQDLLPFTHENVGHPVLAGDHLFFNSPASGLDNIHVLDVRSGKRFQVTSAKYGAYNPAVDADKKFIYYNEQTRNGMDVVRTAYDTASWREFKPTEAAFGYEHLVEQEGEPDLLENIPAGNYPVKKFSKAAHILNPYSWGLLLQSDLSGVDVGISSQDILSTTSLSAGYSFDLAERTGFWRAGLSYQALYPIIDLQFTHGNRSFDENIRTTVTSGKVTNTIEDTYTFSWNETNMEAGLRLPLLLTRSKYASGIDVGYKAGITKISKFENGFDGQRGFPVEIRDGQVVRRAILLDYLANGSLLYNSAELSTYRLLKRSRRDLLSRWGQTLSINYSSTPFGGDFDGEQWSATGYLYFPGLMQHHSFYGYVAYQHTMLPGAVESNSYLFRNAIPIPRGISGSVFRHRYFSSASLNYAFPLWYPDIAVGPVLNLQRVRLNLFADVAQGESTLSNDRNNRYASVGAEVKVDMNIMRFLPQFDLGVRYSYGIEPSATNFELLIGTFNF